MVEKDFDRKVSDFNSSLKLGVDVGLETGGIALVQNNKVIFARTLVDFHENSLKKRRELRRSRRTRRTKEKRLAHLRSWILRQRIKGKQLPDPYTILKDRKYWIKLSNDKGLKRRPLDLINEVINGNDVSSEGFVRALTLIFRKRGYKAVGKETVSSNDFKEKIKNLKSEYPITEERKNDLTEEATLRLKEGEITDKEYSRFNKNINKIYENSKKTNAKDRKITEEQLKKVIHAFCLANGEAKLVDQWYQQLKNILNRQIRKLRFDNRILINCSICGAHTPLKKNVRDAEFELALKNLKSKNGATDYINQLRDIFKRVDEYRKNKTEYSKDIRKEFFSVYKKDGLDPNMKEQIETLLFEPLYGRSRYCRKHIKEQVEGKLNLEYGKLSQKFTINPGFKNHDDRVLNYIEDILFKKKVVDPAKIRYISIEAPQPKTERTKAGKAPERKSENVKDRLKRTFDGVDVYSGEKLEREFEIDHIFPAARGGPYLQENYVPCNKKSNRDKQDRTPYEWLFGDPKKFKAFEERVIKLYNKSKISERKRDILLSREKEYPGENPTNLARVSGNVSYFVLGLQKLFKNYKLPEPVPNQQGDNPIIQVTPGWLTNKLREQWNAEDAKFIPEKDVGNSYNHAEDAAVIASIPPPMWRNRIFRETLKDYIAKEGPNKGKKKDRPGFAIRRLAPCWEDFLKYAGKDNPVVEVLGKNRVSWHNNFMDQTFGRNPDNLEATKKKMRKTEIDSNGNKKRKIMEIPKGGLSARLKPDNGPRRWVQIKPGSNCILLYKDQKSGKTKFIHGFINPIVELHKKKKITLPKKEEEEINELDNLTKSNTKLIRLYNHQIVNLPKREKWEQGYYMISQLGKKSIKALPENKIKTSGERIKSKIGSKSYSKKADRRLSNSDLDYLYTYFSK